MGKYPHRRWSPTKEGWDLLQGISGVAPSGVSMDTLEALIADMVPETALVVSRRLGIPLEEAKSRLEQLEKAGLVERHYHYADSRV